MSGTYDPKSQPQPKGTERTSAEVQLLLFPKIHAADKPKENMQIWLIQPEEEPKERTVMQNFALLFPRQKDAIRQSQSAFVERRRRAR